MAEETNKEILEETQTEGTTEITPETPSEGTVEETPSEGTTTGNGYLTKPYLVRNLQTFWGKIKQYIINQKFVNEDTVRGALLSKADQSDLDSLEDIVGGKADKSALEALETNVASKIDKNTLDTALATKVNVDGDKVLSDNNFTDVFRDKLKNLPASAATHADMGFMSGDDKQNLDELVEKAVTEVDEALSETSTNPVQNKIINEALNGKVDKENPSDPSDLIRLNNITSYATDEGHIVLNFIRDTEHLKIYTPNSDRPIEKVSLKDQNEILFTNFQKNDDDTLAITIENPEGKEGDNWKINFGESFNFYVEDFVLDNSKYKPFILNAKRSNIDDLNEISLNITKVFEL